MSDPSPRKLKLKAQLMLGDEIALGPGKVDLLEAIDRTGSISAAAREMGLSYRRAWVMVDTMNRCFGDPLVERSQGGSHGGGAALTPAGRETVTDYRCLEAELRTVAGPWAQRLLGRLA